jgi:N-acetylmuramoyl-L-alanine amidase
MGFSLAREIHKAYGEVFRKKGLVMRDDGLHYGNLALARSFSMPSVLTESAYMILPEQEALLKSREFQSDCAEAMLLGLKRYVNSMRKRNEP